LGVSLSAYGLLGHTRDTDIGVGSGIETSGGQTTCSRQLL